MSIVSMLNLIAAYDEQTDDLQAVVEDAAISPGMMAFIAILLLAGVSFLLLVSMMRRLRRVRYREEVRAEIAEELAERDRQASDPGQEPGQEPGQDPDSEK